MKRISALVLLLAFGALSLAVSAVQQPAAAGQAAPKVVEVEKLKDNLFVLKGGGGNSAVFITANGVVVVDTKNPGWGAPLLSKIKELTPRPITTVINTHTHGDHVSGNVEFPENIDIVVHENTKANMEKMTPTYGSTPPPGGPVNIFKQNNGRGLAKRSYKDTKTIGSGADRIDLHYFGRGHTNGDTWVLFPALRVVHAGDIYPGKNVPFIDANNGGSAVAIGDTLAKAHAGLNKVADTIITGHSTQMTMNDLNEYAMFNKEFLAAVQSAKKAGKTVDEFAASWTIPAKYTGYAAPQPNRLKGNVEIAFKETK
jgi:glyoxylase-like metal-dependent hydrolase (beta-lactamase superfamily II)